jgi:DMSO/TMAO reductase YedYZ molybdopterin-dependent catalytic subunit
VHAARSASCSNGISSSRTFFCGEARIPSRRSLLKQSVFSGTLLLSGLHKLRFPEFPAEGTRVGVIPFVNEGHDPVGVLLGDELDGRYFTDLSRLAPENPITPADDFYIRTRASKLLDRGKPWTIQLGGLAENPKALRVDDLAKSAKPMGLHLMECAGNSRSAHFGMISVADWSGVALQDILQTLKPALSPQRILISGFDLYSAKSSSSVPGASWIFTEEQLQSSGAFLAVQMNGKPLTLDHGAPVRLFVPGWYGCACIKWVNEISSVADDAPATSQMQEYASRTMQHGVPRLASEYKPATLDAAAMPIRIEKWFVKGKIEFRVFGIQWGGAAPIDGLEIQFNPEENYVPVTDFRASSSVNSWNFWQHNWMPSSSGRYAIRLRAKPTSIPARRLDSGYYVRFVDITDL